MHFPPLPQDDLEYVLGRTRSLWEQLRGQRIFVTGATGFFGTWLLETFAHANDRLDLKAELVGLSRNPEAFAAKAPHLAHHPSLRFHKGDVRDFQFPKGKFSHVIHAGTTPSNLVPSQEMLETIIQGTRHTLDFAMACGAQRFLLVSSGAVYGQQPVEIIRIPETHLGSPDTMTPTSAYGEGKRVAELLCATYHQQHGLETAIARCFAFVGPHLPLDAHFAIGNFIGDAMKGGPIVVQGDGTPCRSYLYAADLAVWLWTILFKGKACRPYNVGSDEEVTISQLAETVALMIGGTVEQSGGRPSGYPLNQVTSRYVPEVRRIMSELELAGIIGLQEALRKTADYISQVH